MIDSTLNTPSLKGNTSGHPHAPEALLREVKYRLSYRGTLELDCLCRAALPYVESLDEAQLTALRDFLLHREGDLMAWLVEGSPCPPAHTAQVAQLRQWFKASL